MSLPEIVSREDWLEARVKLLAREKELQRARDALSAERRRLPMVEVTKEYVFTTPEGPATLRELFGDHLQLAVQHFMFEPAWEDGCPSCTAGADEISDGLIAHLAVRSTGLVVVALAPLDKIERYKAKRGWTFPFVSSYGTDFNLDFGARVDPARPGFDTYNYKKVDWDEPWEQPGTSFFLRDGDRVFHTYSTFARGSEWLGGSYAWLDLTALGRQEDWEEPKGRADHVRQAQPDFAT